MASLEAALAGLEPGLAAALGGAAAAAAAVAALLRAAGPASAGTSNACGDAQLDLDLAADAACFAALRDSGAVCLASSEERPEDVAFSCSDGSDGGSSAAAFPDQYSVAFDPLDGSSVIGADWAVGSIFGLWPGDGGGTFVGRSGREMVAAGYAVHGPRTVLVLARPAAAGSRGSCGGSDNNNAHACVVQEFVLTSSADSAAGASSSAPSWRLVRDGARLPPAGRVFAPANLRAAATGNGAYQSLVSAWMAEKYTLRYSGAMVPDVHHALAKGGGVFCSPTAAGAPAKLRLLYEVLPLAFVAEAAGGAATAAGGGAALDRALRRHGERAGVCLGSAEEVARCDAAMCASTE